jgi:hypothetical protein
MSQPTLERMDAESRLQDARTRAERCSQASPSWDAAMGLVDELEDEIRQLDQVPLSDE